MQQTALIADIIANIDNISALRRDIDAHSELCFEEIRTAEQVATTFTEAIVSIDEIVLRMKSYSKRH